MIAASFSNNTCRLRVDQFLSKIFSINRGTREGGITSPGIFNGVYGFILSSCGFLPPPNSIEALRETGTFAIAYADDLTLVSCDRRGLQLDLHRLKGELERFGMCLNVTKTKLMILEPSFRTRDHFVRDVFVSGSPLERVALFKYLGFWVSQDFSPTSHLEKCHSKLLSSAHQIGSLMSRLQVTDLGRLRLFFISFCRSQLYGAQFFPFSQVVFEKSQACFLKKALNLPRSFANKICVFLLRIGPLEKFEFSIAAKFLRKCADGRDLTLKTSLVLDCLFLRDCFFGLNFHLAYTSRNAISVDEFWNLDLLSDLTPLCSRIESTENGLLTTCLSSMSSFQLFEDFLGFVFPESFSLAFATLDTAKARFLILFLSNGIRWSVFRIPSRNCPLCDVLFVPFHLFECPNVQVNWNSFEMRQDARLNHWGRFFSRLFIVARTWISDTIAFKPGIEL